MSYEIPDRRELFEEKAFVQRFLASIGRNPDKPKNAPSGALDFVSMGCPNKADFVKRDDKGEYVDRTLSAMWWAWKAALVQVQEAGDSWRPIESAPKDRRSILVWCDGNRCAYTAVWLECGRESHWYSFGGIGRLKDEPTHWRPLPSPPELSESLREKGEAGNDAN